MIGKKFGRWTVLSTAGTLKFFDRKGKLHSTKIRWLCKCDCGVEKIVIGESLRSKESTSCGCWQRETNDTYKEQAAKNLVKFEYRDSAILRNFEWSLPDEYFFNLILQECYYCGASPNNRKVSAGKYTFIYNGVDRLSNQLGYTKENTVACCKICNRAKSDQSMDEFFSWIRRIIERMTDGQPLQRGDVPVIQFPDFADE